MAVAANVVTDAGATAPSHSALTDEAVARFHRPGFLVVTGLTTLEDLEIVSRRLAGLYRALSRARGRPARSRPRQRAAQRKILSAHFWVPLQDVTRDMRCMAFIPGSHRGALWRHHRRDRLRDAHALEVVGLDTSHAVPCPIRAGDATVHFPRTVHYTGPNRTGTPRLAWALEFGPRRGLGLRLMAKARLVWRRATR